MCTVVVDVDEEEWKRMSDFSFTYINAKINFHIKIYN